MATKKTTPRKKKKTRSRKKKSELSQPLRILLAVSFLLAFVALCLAFLVNLRERFLGHPELVYEEPVQQVEVQKEYTYDDIYVLVENQLLNGPQSMGWRRLPAEGQVQVRKIFGDFPSEIFLNELNSHISNASSHARLQASRADGIIHLYWQDELQLELRYTIPQPVAPERGRIAIIMDDMGGSSSKIRRLLDLDLIITPALLPGTRKVGPATEMLREAGREFMIHIPMEPRSYPRTNPGNNALLVGQSAEEIRSRIRSYIAQVPGAVGGNNHMGSRFTEEAEPMRIVLEELKRQDFFFIDSRTIGSSVAFSEARKMGLKTATRNIFLDNEEDVAYIRKQIRKMVKLAGNNREIIAICHPYDQTLDALHQEMAWLKSQPVDFVPASQIVHLY